MSSNSVIRSSLPSPAFPLPCPPIYLSDRPAGPVRYVTHLGDPLYRPLDRSATSASLLTPRTIAAESHSPLYTHQPLISSSSSNGRSNTDAVHVALASATTAIHHHPFSYTPEMISLTRSSTSASPATVERQYTSSTALTTTSSSSSSALTTGRSISARASPTSMPTGAVITSPHHQILPAPNAGQNTTDVILTRVFQDQTNVLKQHDRELIVEFLNGRLRINPFDPSTSLHRIILNESKHKDPQHPTRTTIEQIVFEMNFTSGHWRKLRRKAVVRDVIASERHDEMPSKDECPGAEWYSGRIPAGWDSNGNRIDAIQAVTAMAAKHASVTMTPREVHMCGR